MSDFNSHIHFQFDWDSFDDHYEKSLDEDKIFYQFSKFTVEFSKKHSRTVEPLVPKEVWEDPNLTYALRKYLQFCEQDAKIIIIEKPRKIQSLTSNKKSDKPNNDENKRRSANSITATDLDLPNNILTIIKHLQNLPRPEINLLQYESAVDPKVESEIAEVADQNYQNDTIYNDQIDTKRTQVSLKHFRDVSLSAMALPLPINNNSQIRKADPLISPITTDGVGINLEAESEDLSKRGNRKSMQRSASHATLTQSKPMLTLPIVLSPSAPNNSASATTSAADKTLTSSSGSKLGFRKINEPSEKKKPTKARRRASTLADAPPVSVVMSDSFEQMMTTSQSSSVFPHFTSDRQFLLFRCKGLSFDFGLEPFYCTVALYDRSKQVKISEDFKFILNGHNFDFLQDLNRRSKWLSNIQKKKSKHKQEQRTHKALFSQSASAFDTVLMVRIHKLKVSSEEDSSTYYKQDLSDSRTASVKEEWTKHFQGLKSLTWQPFAFSVIPVASFMHHKTPSVPIFAESKYMDDDTLFNLSNNEDSISNRPKIIPGELLFSLKPIEVADLPHYRLDPSARIIDDQLSAIGEITKEIEDFSMLRPPRLDYFCNLYIYPIATLFGKLTNIKVQVEIKDDDLSIDSPGLSVIYSDENNGFLDSYTMFSLPNKLPKHYDEIKCKLPPLTEKHHLLFTFKHTDKESKKQSALGYVVVPLMSQGRVLRDREYIYPILKELPNNYLSQYEPESGNKTKLDIYSQLQMKESKKIMFSFKTKLLSSIYPQDDNLSDFFQSSSFVTDSLREILQERKSFRISLSKVSQLKTAVENLPTSLTKETCVTWFPRIFNELFQIMVSFESNKEVTGLQNYAFVALIEIIKKLKEQTVVNSETLLMNYINFLFDTEIIDEMTQHRVPLHACIVEGWLYALKFKEGIFVTFTSHWFLFDLLARSMVLYAHKHNKLANDSKKQLFTSEYLQQVKEMLLMYCREKWFHTPQISGIISAIGSFFPKLFRLIHRGAALKMLFTCTKKLTQLSKEFQKKNPVEYTRLLDHKWQLLKGAVYKNEDFVPLNMPSLHAASANLDQYISLKGPKHLLSALLIHELFCTMPLRRENLDIQNQAIKLFKATVQFAENTRLRKKTKEALANMHFMYIVKLSEYVEYISSRQAEMNEWLLCFFHILKMSSKHLLRTWLRREIPAKIFLFLRLISLSLFILQEQRCPEILEEVRHISAYISMTVMEERKMDLMDTSNPMLAECIRIVFLLLNVHQTKSDIQSLISPRDSPLKRENTVGVSSARNSPRRVRSFSPHEVELLNCLFKTIGYISLNYKSAVFENLEDDANSFLQLFCYGLFYYMSVDDIEVNEKAINCYVDLIKINLQVASENSKIKLHSIIAMTKLVGDRRIMSAKTLQKSLNSTTGLLSTDLTGENMKSLEEMIQSLITIALYHNKINREDIEYDHSSLVDFYYNIANGSSDSLDLRVSWLISISKLHLNSGDYVEAGLCKVHMACILGRYLVEQEDLSLNQYQLMMSYFPAVVREEDGFLSKSAKRFTTSDFWTLAKYLQLMQDAAENFQQGQMYEIAVNVYNSLIHVLVAQKNYKLVAILAHLLEKSSEKLSAGENGAVRRMFYTYYRVQFFGLKFGEFNGNAYIYKVAESVKLLEFQEYLKKQFSAYSLEFLSNNISEEDAIQFKETKTPSRIRIISVSPYLPPEELDSKTSTFDQHFNINKFTVDLPFTKSGQSSKLSDLFLRRIIYTTEKTFPFIKSRLLVVEREETILNPIQNAKHLILKQTQYLESVTRGDSVNKNLLEQLIQGSIAPMVHSGPSEVLAMFLSDANLGNYDTEDLFYLKQAMKEFVVVCEYAIKLHKSMISNAEQELALHNFFEISLQELKQKLGSVKELVLSRKRSTSRVIEVPIVANLFKTLDTPLYSPEPSPHSVHATSTASDIEIPELSPRSFVSNSNDSNNSNNNNIAVANNNNEPVSELTENIFGEEEESAMEPKFIRRINKRKTQLNRRIKVFYKTYGTEKGKINSLNSNDFTKRN